VYSAYILALIEEAYELFGINLVFW